MEIVTITELIEPILEANGVSLYEAKWLNEGKNRILQIAIMYPDGSMDLDTCQNVSEAISIKLDESALQDVNYFLEVCSAGAERILKNSTDIANAIDQHVYVKMLKPVGKLSEVKGDLLSFEDGKLVIQYQDKAVKRKVTVDEENIAKINLAVKI